MCAHSYVTVVSPWEWAAASLRSAPTSSRPVPRQQPIKGADGFPSASGRGELCFDRAVECKEGGVFPGSGWQRSQILDSMAELLSREKD